MSINNRIEKLVDYYCRGNITEFSTNIGLTNNVTIHRLVNSDTSPSYKVIVLILRNYSNINPNWLLLGEGSMFRGENTAEESANEINDLQTKPTKAMDTDFLRVLETLILISVKLTG